MPSAFGNFKQRIGFYFQKIGKKYMRIDNKWLSYRLRGERVKMKKQEIEKRLQKILDELRMSNQEYYDKKAEKDEHFQKCMKPEDMYAFRCGAIQSEIEWILSH